MRSIFRRYVAMTYGAACLGLAYHSAFLTTANDTSNAQPDKSVILKFLSSEVAREAGGALIMLHAMILCTGVASATASSGGGGSPSFEGVSAVGAVSAVIAVVSIVLGALLPGYLQRSGIAVPAHCGGSD